MVQDEVISVEDGRTVRAECTLRLSKVSGAVRDEAGNPLAGVRLRVLPQGEDETTSDISGRFEVSWDAALMISPDTAFVLVARDMARKLAQGRRYR